MENDVKHSKKLETFLIIVSIFIVAEFLFWTVFSKLIVTYAPASSIGAYYRLISLLIGIIFCAIPITAGILIKNQTWKIVLIVLGGLLFVLRVGLFLYDSLKSTLQF